MFYLRATNISKKFTHKKAVDGSSLSVFSGQIHALLGENGAGKSTLAAILSGVIQASEGEIEIGYSPFRTESLKLKPAQIQSPKDAQERGIVLVHQRPILSESLSVLENTVLGDLHRRIFFSKKKLKKTLNKILKDWEIELDLNKKGSQLNAEESFFAELLSALYKNPKLLILDEPTALLPEKKRKAFFQSLKTQAENGLAVLLITHNLQEALDNANFITVLKKGKVVLAKQNSQNKRIQMSALENALFTSDINLKQEKIQNKKNAEKNISLQKTHTKGQIKKAQKDEAKKIFALSKVFYTGKKYPSLFNISFSVYEGAICYIYGQKASGIESLEEIITGIQKMPFQGTIFFNEDNFTKQLSPRILRKGGAAIISTNKNYRASNPSLSIVELLSVYKAVDEKAEDAETFSKNLIQLEKMPIEIHEPVSNLSGGMLQRLILERELSTEPNLLLFFEPAQGLDAQRLASLANHLRALADMGKAILLVSANREKEFSAIADIQYEMRGGSLV